MIVLFRCALCFVFCCFVVVWFSVTTAQHNNSSPSPPHHTSPDSTMAAPAVKTEKHLVLFYTYVHDVAEKRPPFRAAHLEHVKKYVDEGKIVMAGAWNPVSGAMLIFKSETEDPIKEFVAADPYNINGLVASHEIREWTVVVL
eukprot:TRINITY_DN9991_c0_g1_i1.p1 TRINITY_DN9991_c0_g1~~TRINITY_DN9991_c0_g1_i1.p1  ORF type:complete len:143 (-),score=30.00 TRINITY_DN9991_c0_g1_i1:121-549(-)